MKYEQWKINEDGEKMKFLRICDLTKDQHDILSEQTKTSGIEYVETKEEKKKFERFITVDGKKRSEGVVMIYPTAAKYIHNSKRNTIEYVEVEAKPKGRPKKEIKPEED